jgi:hypothetical protein
VITGGGDGYVHDAVIFPLLLFAGRKDAHALCKSSLRNNIFDAWKRSWTEAIDFALPERNRIKQKL